MYILVCLVLIISGLKMKCDTCDSKNVKSPVSVRVRARVRERIIVFLQFKIPPCKTLYRGCTNLSVDDSKCSSKNDPSFYEK